MTTKYIIFLFFISLSFVVVKFEGWDVLEPVLGLGQIGLIFGLYAQKAKAKKVTVDNGDQVNVVVAQVGKDIRHTVKAQAGQIDQVFCSRILFGKGTVTVAEQVTLAKEIFKHIRLYPNRKFHIYFATPQGVAFVLGQMLGIYNQNVVFYQYDTLTGGYVPMPNITPDDLA
jgi:hypothetical protein